MRKISIVNPAAGQGDAAKFGNNPNAGEVYTTRFVSDAENYVYSACLEQPDTHFIIYGGDGTVNEVVCGIMRAGAQASAAISVVPVGTGNDLTRTFAHADKGVYTLDVMKYNDKYAINMINTGFDCDAARRAAYLKTKPLISGSGAYIMGVLGALTSSYGQHMRLTFTLPDGSTMNADGEYLLCCIANCRYYGGGFLAAPAARYDDGLLDALLIHKVSRPAFLKLVGDYKNGRHLDPETGEPYPKFAHIVKSIRCKSARIETVPSICVDGEIQPISSADITVLEKQLRLII